MKNLKLVIIATILVFSIVSVANADRITKLQQKKSMEIRFEKVVQNPVMVRVMYQQLDASMINDNMVFRIKLRVFYKNVEYLISGTYEQWATFFNLHVVSEGDVKRNASSQ